MIIDTTTALILASIHKCNDEQTPSAHDVQHGLLCKAMKERDPKAYDYYVSGDCEPNAAGDMPNNAYEFYIVE